MSTTILRGATVVDTRDGSLSPAVDVTLTADRITAIAPAADHTAERDGVSVDARGKYLVPGYLDMHAHPLERKDPTGTLELMLATGITGFRQMSGSPKLLRQRADGTLPLPAASPALLALPGTILTPVNAGTAAAAVAEVAGQHAAGADFIKVGFVSPEVFFQAQAEAVRLGIPILGHLPTNIDVIRASRIGLRSIEHLGPSLGIFAACSCQEDAVRAALSRQRMIKLPSMKLPFMERLVAKMVRKIAVNPTALARTSDVALTQQAIDTFDEGKATDLAAHFVADGTWQCPTLIRKRTSQFCDAQEFRTDPNLRYVAPETVKEWTAAGRTAAKRPAAERETFRREFDLQLRLTALFETAGVQMIAGSDCSGAAWEIPGYSLHQEFDLLAQAGLSPLRVLQTTTLNGAEFLGTTNTMGTVEVGKNADLVLLDGNPVEDVRHLHALAGVVRAGRHYSPADLDAIKNRVAATRSVQ